MTLAAIMLALVGLTACSSGDSNDNDDMDNSGTTQTPMGTVPDNKDSNNNNNHTPDNPATIPDNSGDNGSTGGDDNTGNGGGSSDSTDGTDEWEVIFYDEFEGASSTPDPEKWVLTPKGTDTWNRYMSESYNQAYQKDGYLYLFGQEQDGQYYTGGVESRGKFDFTYGQVKCRARFLRQPQGNHSGIWMMPSPPAEKWPRSGEIDIMEHLDAQDVVYETAHFWNESTGEDDSKDDTVHIDKEDFNVYGVIWDKESVRYTVNGKVYFTYKNENPDSDEFSYQYPFTKPFYLILSQSLGGKGTWEGVIDNSELPAIFQIDWIYVYKKK